MNDQIEEVVVESEIVCGKSDIVQIQKQLVIPLMEELDQVVLSSENPSMLASVGNLSVVAERLEDIADP